MSPDALDRKLDAYAKLALPSAPASVAADVWREIERRRQQSFIYRLGWKELVSRPRWTLTGLAFALAVGAAPAMAFSLAQNAKQLARDSLHFEVFSPGARGQIAHLLSKPDNPHSRLP